MPIMEQAGVLRSSTTVAFPHAAPAFFAALRRSGSRKQDQGIAAPALSAWPGSVDQPPSLQPSQRSGHPARPAGGVAGQGGHARLGEELRNGPAPRRKPRRAGRPRLANREYREEGALEGREGGLSHNVWSMGSRRSHGPPTVGGLPW
jgi:hypothetical protein